MGDVVSAADELRALTAAATPGPWEAGADSVAAWMIRAGDKWAGAFVLEADAALIVWLVNHAGALVDLIDDTHAFRDELRQDPDGTWVAHGPTVDAHASALAALEADT